MPDDLAKLLGLNDANNPIGPMTKYLENPLIIEIVEKVNIHRNLVNNKIQTESKLLYSLTPRSSIGRLESPKIYFPIWKTTRSTTINEIRGRLTNQRNESLDFEDNWSVTIQLRGAA